MNVQTLLREAFKELAPPVRMLPSEWAAEHFELPETSAEPGKWNKTRAPYQVGILDAVCEAGVQKVTLMCSAQIGKTIILLIIICYLIHLDPCSMMMTQPTTDMAEMFSKEKLASAITNVKPVAKKIVQKSRNASSTILMKMFAGGFLRLAGANSPSSLASMSIRAYFGDEIDKYPASAGKEGDPVKLAIQRTETFWNWLVFLVSTPSIKENSRIEDEFEESDKRRFFVPCPHCGHKQHLVWERFQYENKDTPEANPLSGVYYICESCDRPIEEKYKSRMLREGQWQATAVAKDPKHIGFHINRFYSPWKGWKDLCLDYESSKDDHQKLQVFWNATLGLPFERVAGEKLDWQKLRDRGSQSNYQQGIVPNGGLILTAGVDVQAERLEVAIVAWGRGEESWVIRYEKILGDPLKPDVWEQLAHVTSQPYPHQSGAELRVRAACIDSGYLTQEVYHQVRKYRYLHWFAIKGQAGDKPLYSKPSVQETNYRGEKVKRGISIYKVGVDVAKETLYARSQIETPGANYINFPNDLDSSWYEGFCSEVQVTKHRNGQPYMVWEKLAGVRNEPLDTAVYALAAAHLAGITRMNLNKLEVHILENVRDKDDSGEHISVKSQSNDVSSSVHMDSNDHTSKEEAPIKSQSNNRRRGRSRSRRSSNFTTDIY
ncbi:MAG: phage terminase large subunit family protein [Pleurocapsa sp. MO_226.B13]|nr:phage terminase large subunit family protein [Pleurocapsa sp. MO_226.B13]